MTTGTDSRLPFYPVGQAGKELLTTLKKKTVMKVNELSPGWAFQQPDPVAALSQVLDNIRNHAAASLSKARATAAALIPSVILFAQAALCVSFGFALMFLAAIIGG